MPNLHEITPAQLMRLVGTPDCPLIVDVCINEDFALDPRLIPSAVRHSHKDMDGMVSLLQGQRAIISCQKGKKLSQGVVAYLRSEGIDAEYVQGGNYGWRDAGLPLVPAGQPKMWITRHRPKIDRIACPWLIRRFVHRDARFMFVAPSQVLDVADRFDATPFDVENVVFSHVGDRCTFDMMLDAFGLSTPPLVRMAQVVRAADTNRHDLDPVAAGLLAVSVGLSRQYKDDQMQLEAGMALYDALYRWARNGLDEGHDWPHATS